MRQFYRCNGIIAQKYSLNCYNSDPCTAKKRSLHLTTQHNSQQVNVAEKHLKSQGTKTLLMGDYLKGK